MILFCQIMYKSLCNKTFMREKYNRVNSIKKSRIFTKDLYFLGSKIRKKIKKPLQK